MAARRGQHIQLYNLPPPPALIGGQNSIRRTSQDLIFGSDNWSARRHSRDQTFSTVSGSTGAPTTPDDEDYVHGLEGHERKRSQTANSAPRFTSPFSSAVGGHYRQFSEADALTDLHSSFAHLMDRGRLTPADISRVQTPMLSQGRSKVDDAGQTKATFDSGSNPAGLMGTSAGHFGPAIREKATAILHTLLADLPSEPMVSVIEYGACRSNSTSLMTAIVAAQNLKNPTATEFTITHTDAIGADFRPVMQQLDLDSSSYLSNSWQALQRPSLQDRVFNSFSARKFGDMVVPRESALIGTSLMDLHWCSAPREGCADVHLAKFLHTRAKEFKTGGVLILAYLQRNESGPRLLQAPAQPDIPGFLSPLKVPARPSPNLSAGMCRGRSGSSPVKPCTTAKQYDIWHSLANTLAPCIQRLVSCGMVKSDVARHLLEVSLFFLSTHVSLLILILQLPIYPRTTKETLAVLKTVADHWRLEHLCGPDEASNPAVQADHPHAHIEPALNLVHPACKGRASGQVSDVVYAEHVLAFCRNVYEGHFRWTLKERGNLGRGAVEWILDALWSALKEKVSLSLNLRGCS